MRFLISGAENDTDMTELWDGGNRGYNTCPLLWCEDCGKAEVPPQDLKVPDIAVDRESLSAAKVPLRCRLGLHDMKLVRWDIPGRLLKLRCRRCPREEMRDA